LEAICSSETSVVFHRTTQLFTPEDDRCEKLKSYIFVCLFVCLTTLSVAQTTCMASNVWTI
jgi:hypothetical protein